MKLAAPNIDPKWWLLLGWITLVYLLITLFSSCTTARKVDKFINKNPLYSAKLCDSLYPIKTDVVTYYETDSALLNQYEIEFAELYKLLDSLMTVDTSLKGAFTKVKTVVQRVEVPKIKVVEKTKESTARLTAQRLEFEKKEREHINEKEGLRKRVNDLEQELEKAKSEEKKAKKERNRYLWLLVLSLVFIFRKPIWKGVRKLITKI